MLRSDLICMIYTVALVFFCWTVAFFIKLKKPVSDIRREVARKFVHIGVSNWFFIYCSFTSWIWPVCGLAGFAVINYFIEIKTGQRRSWGTVYFPISIIMMIAMKELGFGNVVNVGAGLLGMGYADGLAALIGRAYGKSKMIFTKNKTVAGSTSVLIITEMIVYLMTGCQISTAFLIGVAAMVCEAYTPFGLDNVSVPIIIYILSTLLC